MENQILYIWKKYQNKSSKKSCSRLKPEIICRKTKPEISCPCQKKNLDIINLSKKNTDTKEIIDFIFDNTVNTKSPYFANQLFSTMDNDAILGEFISLLLNTSMYTYQVSTILTDMELEVIKKMCQIIGFKSGQSKQPDFGTKRPVRTGETLRLLGFPRNSEGDGIFCPGASICNLYAMILSLETWQKYDRKKMIVYSSKSCHYSIDKNAKVLGIKLRKIDVDDNHRFNTRILEKVIQKDLEQGLKPIMIVGTAGTTVTSSFDPFVQLSTIAKKYNLWFHIDGALGASIIFSKKYKYLLRGTQEANSITWNPHKLLGMPLQCSILLTKNKNLLKKKFSSDAKYLFNSDKKNLGQKSLQCGRKTDVIKLWLTWKINGQEYFEKKINRIFDLKNYFLDKIGENENLEMLKISHKYIGTNVCFRHKNKDTQKFKIELMKKGIYINISPLKSKYYFRFCINSHLLTEKIINEIISYF